MIRCEVILQGRNSRFGNFDIFIMSAAGGDLKRLTWYSGADYPTAFSPDGKQVYFNSLRTDLETYADFPNRAMPELYSVSIQGGREKMLLTTPSENAIPDPSGNRIYYQDRKGYEDPFRKHHRSSITRDQVQPGDTLLTRTRSGARSMAMLRVSCTSAALLTGYSQRPVCATPEEMLVKLTTAPPPARRMWGRAALSIITALTRFTSRAWCQSARPDCSPSSR